MRKFKSKISNSIVIIIVSIVIIGISMVISNCIYKEKPVAVKTQSKLENIYNGRDFLYYVVNFISYPVKDQIENFFSFSSSLPTLDGVNSGSTSSKVTSSNTSSSSSENSSVENNLDYSTTNIQVEDVDEADVIKTDGNYIYSISENEVIITDVTDESNPVIVSRISADSVVPKDMMIYNNNLVVINELYKEKNNKLTEVNIYDVSDKSNPKKEKSFKLNQSYYTSRMIDGNLYVILSGKLKLEDKSVVAYYEEDNEKINIDLKKMFYFKDNLSNYETVIAHINLNSEDRAFDVQAYISDVDYIYVSENNIYLAYKTDIYSILENKKNYNDNLKNVNKIFGITGIWGCFDDFNNRNKNIENKLTIIKLGINEDGTIKYVGKATEEGKAVDQFSFDEYDSNLRVAIQDGTNGSKIVVFDKKMKKIGESKYVGEGETMYSSRFIGEKAYLVTYKTVDPLFVFDLSNPKSPTLLGELKISGYSIYLHPYDENHLIGIGLESGKMKMALFDVSDVENPKLLSEVKIGDGYTRSEVLKNHKALLFSKEKGLIAIPVKKYGTNSEDNNVSSNNINSLLSSYNTSEDYITEGYLVYDISVESGINLKGVITHEADKKNTSYSNQVLRGLYIKDNLFTVSQHMLKVNKLDTLSEISKIEI